MNRYFIFVFLTSILFSCTMPTSSQQNDEQVLISVINWNLQTFFDGVTEGTEYDDYKGAKSTWNEDKYKKRLIQLCKFIDKTKADIYVFQEIENSGILQDISNELTTNALQYGYSCFSKHENEALGIAILSRYPLQNISVHQLDFSVALGMYQFDTSENFFDGFLLEQPSMRAILNADVFINERKSFSLYACHWKSKFGGAEKSEIWRNAQESLLADLLHKEEKLFLVTGDFNRTLEEFMNNNLEKAFDNETITMHGIKNNVEIVSAWLEHKGKINKEGSYFFENKWEKIDHFFYSKGMEVVDFQIITDSMLITEKGIPYRYDIYNEKGVSDHFPLLSVLEL